MFRDARGVVHTLCSTDPLDDLPAAAARSLQDALLPPVDDDLASALERCDAVRDLLERWQDAFFTALPAHVDLAEEAAWASRAGMSLADLEAGYEEDDEDDAPLDLPELDPQAEDLTELLLEPDEEDPRSVLPEDLVAVLERELLLLPVRTRLEALVAAADLVGTWSDLLADHEKLLGHLVLAHAADAAAAPHGALADRHASLHARTGPAHA